MHRFVFFLKKNIAFDDYVSVLFGLFAYFFLMFECFLWFPELGGFPFGGPDGPICLENGWNHQAVIYPFRCFSAMKTAGSLEKIVAA